MDFNKNCFCFAINYFRYSNVVIIHIYYIIVFVYNENRMANFIISCAEDTVQYICYSSIYMIQFNI